MALERGRTRSDGAMINGIFLLGMMMLMYVMLVEAAEVIPNLAVIEMKVQNLYPESFDWDAKHNRFLVGSTSLGRLMTVTEEGEVEDFVKDEEYANAGAMILGVTVDSVRNRVLAVVHKTADPPHGRPIDVVAAYDLDSKKRTLFVNLLEEDEDGSVIGTEKFVANDVAVDVDGNAYVTNSRGYSIWKVTPEGVKSVFVDSVPQLPVAVAVEEFQKVVTLNGIVHDDGYLLISQTNSGALFRVRLADKEVQAVKIKEGMMLPGADGMALRLDGSLVVVSMHTAYLLSSRDAWRSATVLDKVPLDSDFSTSGTVVNDLRVFTIHHHYFDRLNGVDRDSFKILEIEFPSDLHDSPLWLLAVVGIFAVLIFAWKFQLRQFNKEYTKKRV